MSKTNCISAPFNFVPVSDKVFFPPWAEQISQDVPFRDALSGTIRLTITAETPMFIRNGSDREDSSFSHLTDASGKNRYFIPGSSIKGEVRSVLEIMSFSKMRVDESAAFAIREISRNTPYEIQRDSKSVRCGWLRQTPAGGGFVIYDCGSPYRISLRRIDEYLGKEVMQSHFLKSSRFDLNKEHDGFDPKSAVFKYHLVEESGHALSDLEGLPFSPDRDANTRGQGNRVFIDLKSGSRKGTIVFTGQPGPRDGSKGKFYDFVFPVDCNSDPLPVDDGMMRHFRFIYFNTSANEKESKKNEIRRLKGLLNDPDGRGLPVFFRLGTKASGTREIKDFGLAYLYKLPYGRTPYASLPPEHREKERRDLAECIFGFTSPERESLRGRVHFGSAFSDNAAESAKQIDLALSSPKASYYPIYIRQKGKDGVISGNQKASPSGSYATYDGGRLSGWKRYHVRNQPLTGPETYATDKNGQPNDRLNTHIRPVNKGAVFTSDITFHNLRPEELGALLSALTFHNTRGCFHQLGQGRPYGYGRSAYEVALDRNLAARAGYFMACFEKTMNDFTMERTGTPWLQSEQMTSLLSMAHEKVDGQGYSSDDFRYMHMDNIRRNNEFLQAKNSLEYLQPVSALLRKKSASSLEGEQKKERMEEMESLVRSVLGRLQEPGGEPDEKILSDLQKFENDEGARIAAASLRNICEEKKRLKKEAEEEERRRQEEAEARKKREQEEAAAQRKENNRALLDGGLKAFLGTQPLAYGQWCGKVKKWLALITADGRTALSKDEQAAAIIALKPACANPKTRKAIKWNEVKRLVGRPVTEDTVNHQKA